MTAAISSQNFFFQRIIENNIAFAVGKKLFLYICLRIIYNEIIINEELKVAWGEALAEKKKKQKISFCMSQVQRTYSMQSFQSTWQGWFMELFVKVLPVNWQLEELRWNQQAAEYCRR